MEVTLRELVTIVHGMLFGGFFLMAIGGAIVLLLEWSSPNPEASPPRPAARWRTTYLRSEEQTSEIPSPCNLVCRPLLEKKKDRNDFMLAVERQSDTCRSVPPNHLT